MISMGLAGQTGPERSYKGFGTVIQGSAGITHFTGWPDRPPVGTGVAYTDFFASHVGAFALLCALEERRRTGRGQYIDLSQQEASMCALDAALLDYSANGRVDDRQGNRHPSAAPHGAFACLGDDAWVAIAVFTDAQWRGLRAVMGDPAWAADERFATLLGRKQFEDVLEARVGEWTATMRPEQAVECCRAAGVEAAVAATGHDLQADPQLQHRGHFIHLNHPVLGDFPFDALSYRLDGARPEPPRAAPLLGQDNTAVYRDLLGLTEAEYEALEGDGVFK
jgi:crotonobetainyl-CoA:carnitine CoA-transferase CaiB-like acyl-CoA transferase